MRRLLPLFLLAVIVSACSSIECPINNVVEAVYTLRKATGEVDTLYDTLTITTQRSDGQDTVLLNKAVGITEILLPMSHTNDVDVLNFTIGGTTDVVKVSKTNIPHFESVDCTPSYFHEITGVEWTGTLIDDIVTKKTAVSYDTTTNFYIVFKKSY